MTFRILTIALALAAGIAAAAPAQAQERDRSPRQYGETDPIVLRPDRAYIFYRTPDRTSYRFLREPDAAELEAHAAARLEAYTRARTRAERQLAAWQRTADICRPRSVDPRCREQRPVMPTEATFEYPLVEADNFTGNSYRPRLINQDAWSGWLIAVEPGTYALYGSVAETTNGTGGMCYCMGSIRFEAKAGEITDMGEIVGVPADQSGVANAQEFRLGHFVSVQPWASTMRNPAQFANLRVVPAELRAAPKMKNYFGIPITRLAPIPGVLGYERDQIVDLRTDARVRIDSDQ